MDHYYVGNGATSPALQKWAAMVVLDESTLMSPQYVCILGMQRNRVPKTKQTRDTTHLRLLVNPRSNTT